VDKNFVKIQCLLLDRFTINVAVKQRDDLHVTVDHNHEPDVAEVDAVKVKSVMHDQVSSSRTQPAQVLSAAMHSAITEAASGGGSLTPKRKSRPFSCRIYR